MIREGAVSKVFSFPCLVPGVTARIPFGEALPPVQLLGPAVAGVGAAAATRGRKGDENPASSEG